MLLIKFVTKHTKSIFLNEIFYKPINKEVWP
jgi:hypothetical protein